MAGPASARFAQGRTAADSAPGPAPGFLGGDTRRAGHLRFPDRARLVPLRLPNLPGPVFSLSPRTDGVAQPAPGAVALVPSPARNPGESLGRFPSRGADRVRRLAAGEAGALGQGPAPRLISAGVRPPPPFHPIFLRKRRAQRANRATPMPDKM